VISALFLLQPLQLQLQLVKVGLGLRSPNKQPKTGGAEGLGKRPGEFSSAHFDNSGNYASPIHRRFSCKSWAPVVGDGDEGVTPSLSWVQM